METRKTTIRDLPELVAEYLKLDQAMHQAQVKAGQAKRDFEATALAGQYESVEAYIEASERRGAAEVAMRDAEAAERHASEQRQAIERQLLNVLPVMVWIRVGDIGIGVAATNWGGHHVYIETAPWQEKMPSLDHYHRGD